EWLVTGQKGWTSGAQYSDIGEIICRTDPDLPKHKGLTGFVVDMHAPGVEVRPLRQMTGGASFNEVFFNEVRVPDDHRLGDVNQGWSVALTTLMNERASIGAGGVGGGSGLASGTRLFEMVRHFGLDKDPVTRQDLVELDAEPDEPARQRVRDQEIRAGHLIMIADELGCRTERGEIGPGPRLGERERRQLPAAGELGKQPVLLLGVSERPQRID